MFRLALLGLFLIAPSAHASQNPFPSTYALARHAGIRPEVAAKIALSAQEASGKPTEGLFATGLRDGNLMKASAGLPAAPREAIAALVMIRARLPLEALDCETSSDGSEPNCLSSAAALAGTLAASPGPAERPLGSFTPQEREEFARMLAPAPAKPASAFLGANDAWSAAELLGENDASNARGAFDAMYDDQF